MDQDEELYEDLPGDIDAIQEELYDSIEPYQQEKPLPPTKTAPPPLPSVTTIPSSGGPPLPARNDPPSLPPRNQLASTMSGSRMNAGLPPPMAAPPPPTGPPMPPPVSPKSPVSPQHNSVSSISAKDVNRHKPAKNVKPPPKKELSSGGIDMKTIQQEALKKRGHINLEALEKKNKKEDSSSDAQAPPPWATQLKKRKPVDSVSNTSVEDKEEENLAPWVRSKRGSFSEDAPAWVRKRLDSHSDTPPPVAKKPIKDKVSELPELPTVNGGIDLHKPTIPVGPKLSPKPSPKPGHLSPKPLNDSNMPTTKPRPPIAPKVVSPKPSPTLPPRIDSLEPQSEEMEKTIPHTLPRVAKKVPPPKPPRADIPPPLDGENRPLHNETSSQVADLGPPRFTPELPTSPPFSQAKEMVKPPPTLPKRVPPPSIPAPPPPLEMAGEIGPPPFSPPESPAPPPPVNQPPPLPPSNPAPPPPRTSTYPPPITSTIPSLPPRQIPAPPPQVPPSKRYRRRPIPFHDAYSPPGVPDRGTKPGRSVAPKPAAPAPPMIARPQIKPPIASSANTTIPSLPEKPPPPIPTMPSLQQKAPPPPPPPAPEEFEAEDFYDDVDTVKKAANMTITGVTTTESNVDEEEGELYDDVAGATSIMQRPPIKVAPPPPPPPELEQDDNYDLHPEEPTADQNYDLHPEEPTADENYDLHPADDRFEQDQTYEMPPPEPPQESGNGDGVPVEESFYETVASDSKTLQPHSQGTASLSPTSNTMPSPNMSKKLSKAELKEQKKREKEMEKERILQEKEQEKQRILQEKEREKNEKERKRLEELRQKNRKKYFVKNFKQFGFNPDSVACIFATEAITATNKEKDHLTLQGGERILVLLTSHEKLPEGKYLCEKDDGTVGFVEYRNLRDNVEGECGQEAYNPQKRSFPPPSIPAPPPPS